LYALDHCPGQRTRASLLVEFVTCLPASTQSRAAIDDAERCQARLGAWTRMTCDGSSKQWIGFVGLADGPAAAVRAGDDLFRQYGTVAHRG
jgi:hypothetical protein